MTRHTRRGGARSLAALALAAGPYTGTAIAQEEGVIELAPVEIRAPRLITPLPGVVIDRDQATTNVQRATASEIERAQSISITDFMNGQMQSVSVNDYQGNPFQQDLVFRGFSASPQIGTPQGLSVYLDGVRINEAFGEVVNWDMLPMNAIASMDVLPGSNPLFGLNTLGGAIAIRTKNGFDDTGVQVEGLTGSWGRRQYQGSFGANNGTVGLFAAANIFDEDGWRINSPSEVRQFFSALTVRGRNVELNLSGIKADNRLVGNGLVPIDDFRRDTGSVFTSPDKVRNDLSHLNLNGRLDLDQQTSISLLAYHRTLRQNAMGADFYDEFPALADRGFSCPNGSAVDGAIDGGSGCAGVLPNGLFNFSSLSGKSNGLAMQLSVVTERHQLVVGASYDRNRLRFSQSQLLGEISASREVVANPDKFYDDCLDDPASCDPLNPYIPAARFPVVRNELTGGSTTRALFFSDIWAPVDNLNVSFGARLSKTRVLNNLSSDVGKALYNFDPQELDPKDPAHSPESRFVASAGDYTYKSLNPAIGVSWLPSSDLSLFASVSRGARAPSAIELGCAIDRTQIINSTNYQYGCSIPTALTSDPYLRQVRSLSTEIGARGRYSGFDWNVGLFRTALTDDILFVPLGRKNRGVFDNFGKTRREGLESGFSGPIGKAHLRMNYTYLRATYESPARIINPNNSSNEVSLTDLQNYVSISPGDSMAGIPRHIFQASLGYSPSDRWDMTLGMVMHSSAYVRGNENNEHAPRPASNEVVAGGNRDPYDYVGPGKTPGYAVFNLRLQYRIVPDITLFARIDNLFDRRYLTAGDLGRTPFTGGSGFIDPSGFNFNSSQWLNTTFVGPGAPRAFWIGIKVALGSRSERLAAVDPDGS